MGLFGRGVDEKLDSVKELLQRNISKFTEWITYFQQKNSEQDSRLSAIERRLEAVNNPDNMNYVFSRLNNLENDRFGQEERSKLNYVYSKIHELEQPNENIKFLSSNQLHILNRMKEIEERLANLDNASRQSIVSRPATAHERIVKKVKQRSKDYIKNSVISLIQKYESITGSQLKEIIVEEQGLCSKSSFYRLLDEIEQEEKIKSDRNGREKMYKILHVLK